jgi:hypothetical protein
LLEPILRVAVLDRQVAALHITHLAQTFSKRREVYGAAFRRAALQIADSRRVALRARCERPCYRYATEKDDEIAPSHLPLKPQLPESSDCKATTRDGHK